jgi:hypothetical protein
MRKAKELIALGEEELFQQTHYQPMKCKLFREDLYFAVLSVLYFLPNLLTVFHLIKHSLSEINYSFIRPQLQLHGIM